MEAMCSSETSVSIIISTRRHNPEERHSQWHENLKSNMLCTCFTKICQQKCRWMKWSLHTKYSAICINFIFRCSSVALLLSTLMRCTQDGSLDDAISHYKQAPLHSDRRYCRKVAFDTYRLSLSDNFKSDIAIIPVWKLHIAMNATSQCLPTGGLRTTAGPRFSSCRSAYSSQVFLTSYFLFNLTTVSK
jgi:hypothetical protein